MFTNWDARDVGSLEEVFPLQRIPGGRPTRCGVEGAKGRGGSRRPGPGPGRGAVRRLRCHSNPQSSSPPVRRCSVGSRAPGGAVDGTAQATVRLGTRRSLLVHRARRVGGSRGHGRGGPPPAVGFSGTGHARRGASAQRPAQPRPGSNRLDCSRRIAHGCGRAQRPVVWQGHGRRARRVTRQGETLPVLVGPRHSPAPRPRPWRRVALQASAAGRRVPRAPSGGTNPVAPAA